MNEEATAIISKKSNGQPAIDGEQEHSSERLHVILCSLFCAHVQLSFVRQLLFDS